MGYTEALKAAGAKVLMYADAGSYQGEWVAVVEVDGEVRGIHDFYGSCSGCDAFLSEFGYNIHSYEKHGNDTYFSEDDEGTWQDDCAECQAFKAKLKVFGKRYLDESAPVPDLIADLDNRSSMWNDAEKAKLKDALTNWQSANTHVHGSP